VAFHQSRRRVRRGGGDDEFCPTNCPTTRPVNCRPRSSVDAIAAAQVYIDRLTSSRSVPLKRTDKAEAKRQIVDGAIGWPLARDRFDQGQLCLSVWVKWYTGFVHSSCCNVGWVHLHSGEEVDPPSLQGVPTLGREGSYTLRRGEKVLLDDGYEAKVGIPDSPVSEEVWEREGIEMPFTVKRQSGFAILQHGTCGSPGKLGSLFFWRNLTRMPDDHGESHSVPRDGIITTRLLCWKSGAWYLREHVTLKQVAGFVRYWSVAIEPVDGREPRSILRHTSRPIRQKDQGAESPDPIALGSERDGGRQTSRIR
jgi:hypothetical protein